MNRKLPVLGVVAVVLWAFACSSSAQLGPTTIEPEEGRWEKLVVDGSAGRGAGSANGYGADMADDEDRPMKKPSAEPASAVMGLMSMAAPPPPAEPAPDANAEPGGTESSEQVRQWFPEAFLWRPLVETDASGTATVELRVPDELTTWRVLALAHTSTGRQAGTVATFDSSLPIYVDPVVPGWLYAGDRFMLPVQVVNTTASPMSASLSVEATGPLSGSAAGAVSLPAFGSTVEEVAIVASGAGGATVKARLVGQDAAIRAIPVLPAGRPVESVRGGTVGSTRQFTLVGPELADPTTQQTTVLVFPGPLAVLQAEVERGGLGVRPWDAAYGFALAERLGALSAAMHVEADPKAVRKLQIVSWQRVVDHARSPDGGTAADLLAAMKGVHGHEQAEETAVRLGRQVIADQRGDGTWARQSSASLQEVLVQTAFAGWALSADTSPGASGARRKAEGALERHLKDVEDPYTAAVVLASGLVDGDTAVGLRKLVVDGLSDSEGGKTVGSPGQAVNAWGDPPSRAEVLAWTVLALGDDAETKDVRGDLVAELMSGYDASWGFGAGPADVLALEAVATTLPGLDGPVSIVLKRGGVEVDRQALDPSQPKVPAMLASTGSGAFELSVEPPVPGLAFVATQHSWVPWTGQESLGGVDLEVKSSAMKVGDDGTITLTLAAPSGTSLTVEQGLPPGASVDEDALAGLSDRLVEWTVKTDRVRVVTRGFLAGEVIEVPIRVKPAFAGTFTTVPLTVAAQGAAPTAIAPLTWTVEGA